LLNERQGKGLIKLEDLVFELDLPHFFDYFKIINAKALAQRIGMNQCLLAQYVGGQKTLCETS